MRVCPRCQAIYSDRARRCIADGQELSLEAPDPLEGRTLDRYQLVERLGAGMMGAVYRAVHAVLGREHALKILFRDLVASPQIIERFRREAQVMSAVRHPNIVDISDFVAVDDKHFIVMEMVRGTTLEAQLAERGPLAPARAAELTRQIAVGLGEAHARGFLHRDVKPSNVMLVTMDEEERVKLVDFGMAGLLVDLPGQERLTAIGQILGTPLYIAPEHVRGQTAGPEADLYSLGCMLFEMLTGRTPFVGQKSLEVLLQQVNDPPPVLPPHGGLELIVAWLLEKDPTRRPRSAEQLIDALARIGFSDSGVRPAPPMLLALDQRVTEYQRPPTAPGLEATSSEPFLAKTELDPAPRPPIPRGAPAGDASLFEPELPSGVLPTLHDYADQTTRRVGVVEVAPRPAILARLEHPAAQEDSLGAPLAGDPSLSSALEADTQEPAWTADPPPGGSPTPPLVRAALEDTLSAHDPLAPPARPAGTSPAGDGEPTAPGVAPAPPLAERPVKAGPARRAATPATKRGELWILVATGLLLLGLLASLWVLAR